MRYVDLITQDKKETDLALAPARAEEMKAKLGLEIATKELTIKGLQSKVELNKRHYPLNTDTLLTASDELEWQQRTVRQLKTILKELFE